MKYVDVIGIGAINYDYMFSCKNINDGNVTPDDGKENMGRPDPEVKTEILALLKTCKNYTTQIGGSSLLALNTIKAIDKTLSIAFVGVCGKTDEFDEAYGLGLDPIDKLSFIDNKEWLFYADETIPKEYQNISRASVKLNKKNTRGNINISKGANDYILDYINKKQDTEHTRLVDFLKQAKWIHISSLSQFELFEKMMDFVIEAKSLNRFLKISIDPGNQYTEQERTRLQKYLKIADYVFLNENEYNHLILNEDLPDNEKYIKLFSYLNDINNTFPKVFVIKYKNRHELIDFINKTPYIYYHKTLPFGKIHNDTGAGDCFAGGFIAGQLSDRLLSQQPASIELGVLASRTKMTTLNNDEVYSSIEKEASNFFYKKYINGSNNKQQKFISNLKKSYKFCLSFFSGVIASIIASIIYTYIFK